MHTYKSQSDESLIGKAITCPSAHASAREGDARAAGEVIIPPLVKRGESLLGDNFPDSGENYLLASRNGRSVLIAHPLPKPDGVPYAAITDYLNCTFPFNSSDIEQFIVQLFAYLGERFSPAIERGRPLHFYPSSYSP